MGTYNIDNLPLRQITLPIPLKGFTSVGANGFTHSPGTFAAPIEKIAGDVANNNTKTGDGTADWNVHEAHAEYGGIDVNLSEALTDADLTVRVRARSTGTCATAMTVDVTAFRSNAEGSVDTSIGTSGDLCETAAQTVSTSWANYDFTIDGEDLLRGDKLNIGLRLLSNDNGGTGGGAIEIGSVRVISNIRGD